MPPASAAHARRLAGHGRGRRRRGRRDGRHAAGPHARPGAGHRAAARRPRPRPRAVRRRSTSGPRCSGPRSASRCGWLHRPLRRAARPRRRAARARRDRRRHGRGDGRRAGVRTAHAGGVLRRRGGVGRRSRSTCSCSCCSRAGWGRAPCRSSAWRWSARRPATRPGAAIGVYSFLVAVGFMAAFAGGEGRVRRRLTPTGGRCGPGSAWVLVAFGRARRCSVVRAPPDAAAGASPTVTSAEPARSGRRCGRRRSGCSRWRPRSTGWSPPACRCSTSRSSPSAASTAACS